MSLYLGENLISGVATPIEPTRNIGQIIQSTIPLTDAGLHLLDGAVISGSGSYSEFVTYIAGLVNTYPDLFETEANWQTSVTNYGVCGKFVYDSVNNTVRLPKITGFIEGTTDVTALGDLIEAGLPNIEAVFVNHWRDYANQKSITPVSGAIEVDSNTYPKSSFPNIGSESGGSYYYDQTLKINASLSNTIYGNSSTVQPQSIKVLYYIVIATSTKTDIEVDIDEIATDLNSKVDKANLAECQVVVETYINGTSGYRLWSDGYCEQWGQVSTGANTTSTINFVKTFKNTDYNVTSTNLSFWDNTAWSVTPVCLKDSSSSFRIGNVADTTVNFSWHACGYTS